MDLIGGRFSAAIKRDLRCEFDHVSFGANDELMTEMVALTVVNLVVIWLTMVWFSWRKRMNRTELETFLFNLFGINGREW